MSKLHGSREQEWQFAATGLDAARDWIARQPGGYSVRRFEPRATLELHDTYFDSADWMIFRAGFALRLRHELESAGNERTELTLKSLNPGRDGFADRVEYTERLATPALAEALAGESALAERIRALIGTRALSPLFHAHTRRERQQLLEADTDLPLAEVDLDHTSLETPGGTTRELTRIEVECLNADAAVLAPWVEQLRIAAQLEPANESKFRAGLSIAGLEPASVWQAPRRELDPAMPFDAAVIVVLGKYFAVTLACESQVRLGNPEAVHQMRVAARHLDVLIKSFAKYAPVWAVRSRRIVRVLIKRLGAVRDSDVQLAYLDSESIESPQARSATDTLRAFIATDRQRARRELLDFFDAADTRDWSADWRREIDAGAQPRTVARHATTAAVAHDLIRAQARKLRKRADRIDARSSPDDYHEVRIRAKRLRYTLDAFASLYGEPAEEYLRALARFQTVLGDFHDAHVRAERFTALASGEIPAAASFAMGRLVERDAGAFDVCRERFPKTYRRIRRRRWRELQDIMRRLAGPPA